MIYSGTSTGGCTRNSTATETKMMTSTKIASSKTTTLHIHSSSCLTGASDRTTTPSVEFRHLAPTASIDVINLEDQLLGKAEKQVPISENRIDYLKTRGAAASEITSSATSGGESSLARCKSQSRQSNTALTTTTAFEMGSKTLMQKVRLFAAD
ncbi:unnamed protein product [Protopolystoma xenopodis]|uniref:Uncharacterized protein n=1 Tax=Protopolystoma xenopodis TaxID=117903 RepID=A0A3S5A097_9PLAT|nr:unnamed protein product [Protopolystoma xenopodis]